MWLQQRFKGLPGLLSSSWARRLLVGLLLLLIFYWYLGAERRWSFPGSALAGGPASKCLQAEIHRWSSLVERGEGVYSAPQEPRDTPFVSGNGHLLLDVDANKLWVASSAQPGSGPVHQTEFSPRTGVQLEGKRAEAKATMLWFRKGSVLEVRCVAPGPPQASRECVSIREEFMAHRSRANVYLQRIHISNPYDRAVSFEVSSPNQPFAHKFSTSVEKLEDKEVLLSSGKVHLDSSRMVVVVVVSKKLAPRVQVAAKADYRDTVLAVVWTSEPIESSKVEETFGALREGAKAEMVELLRLSVDELVVEHQQAWVDLFISGEDTRLLLSSRQQRQHLPPSLPDRARPLAS